MKEVGEGKGARKSVGGRGGDERREGKRGAIKEDEEEGGEKIGGGKV